MIHESSIVEHTAIIGQGTKVWHFCHIDDGARIGVGCSFGQNCYVGKMVVIGDGVKVQNNVSIWTGVTIGDDVFIGPNATFTNIKYPRADINQKDNFVETFVHDGATLGANCTIIAPCKIGKMSVVAAGAVVNRDVPDYCVVAGSPAKLVRGIFRYGVLNQDIENMVIKIPKNTLVECRYHVNLNKWGVNPFNERYGDGRYHNSVIYIDEKFIDFIPTDIVFETHPNSAHKIKPF